MADCSVSGCSGDGGPGFTCNYCEREHCSDHRLPENHACPGLAYSERRGKRLEGWHDTLEGDSSSGILSRTKQTVLGGGDGDDAGADGADAGARRDADRSATPMDHEGIPTYGGADDDDLGTKSPDVAPDGSLRRSTEGQASDDRSGDGTNFVGSLKRLEHHFVNLPWYTLGAVRRYGPTLVFLAAVVVVALVATGHQVPVDVAGVLPDGGGDPAAAAGPTATTAAAGGGLAATTTADAPRPTTSTPAAAGVPGIAADGDLNETWLEHRIHQYVNRQRRDRGLNSLDWNQTLHDAADFHSRQMVEDDFFAHEHPETGATFEDRYFRVGVECRVPVGGGRYATGGENLAQTYYEERIRLDNGSVVTYDTPDELAAGLVRQWMRSEGHRENLLREYWRQEGIGVEITETDEGTAVYATQNFC